MPYSLYMKNTATPEANNSLEPGTIYSNLDDAMRAASCLCGLHANGATVYGTTDGLETARAGAASLDSGEAYVVAVGIMDRITGKGWPVPPSPYEPIYTITKAQS
jgi:hypothetical protein